MTVKELAEFTGKTERTVQRWVTKAYNKMSLHNDKMSLRKGHESDFTIDEVELILKASSLSRDAVSILMNNARSTLTQPVGVTSLNAQVDYEIIGKMIGVAITSALAPIVEKLNGIPAPKKERLQIEAPKITPRTSIRKTINEYVAKTGTQYKDAYNALYCEFGYRTHCNASLCAKNRNMRTLDYIDEIGQMEVLDAIAKDYFKEDN